MGFQNVSKLKKMGTSIVVLGAFGLVAPACQSDRQARVEYPATQARYEQQDQWTRSQQTQRAELDQTYGIEREQWTAQQKQQKQQALQPGQSYNFTGRLVSVREVQVTGQEPHLVATVETEVFLGTDENLRNQQLSLQPGAMIHVDGQAAEFQGRQALVADQLNLNNKTMKLDARATADQDAAQQQTFGIERQQPSAQIQRQGDQQHLAGEIVSMQQINLPAQKSAKMATMHTDVLLGDAKTIRQRYNLNQGQAIEVRGQRGTVQGQTLLVADQIHTPGLSSAQQQQLDQTYGIERQQQDQTRQQTQQQFQQRQQYDTGPQDSPMFELERQTEGQEQSFDAETKEGGPAESERWYLEQRLPDEEGDFRTEPGLEQGEDIDVEAEVDVDAQSMKSGEAELEAAEIEAASVEEAPQPSTQQQQQAQPVGEPINVTLTASDIAMPRTLQAGQHTFSVTNFGTSELMFIIHDDQNNEIVKQSIAAGETQEVEAQLEKGQYTVLHAKSLKLEVTE